MKARLIAVLLDVVTPAKLAGILVEGVEIPSAGTDEQQISRNCGRRKHSTVGIELPANGGIRGFARLGLVEFRPSGKRGGGQYEDCDCQRRDKTICKASCFHG